MGSAEPTEGTDLYRVSIMCPMSASPTARLLPRYRRTGTQNDRLGENLPAVCGSCPFGVRGDLHEVDEEQQPLENEDGVLVSQ